MHRGSSQQGWPESRQRGESQQQGRGDGRAQQGEEFRREGGLRQQGMRRQDNDRWVGGSEFEQDRGSDESRGGYGRSGGGVQDWGSEGAGRQAPWATGGYGNGQGGTLDRSYEHERSGRSGVNEFGAGDEWQRGSPRGMSGRGGDGGAASSESGSGWCSGQQRSSWRERSGPKGYTRSDERIRDDICERLHQREELEVGEVGVEVKDGIATLEGSVPSREMKHRIEDLVDDCIGVREVENRLKVARPGQGQSRG